MQTVSTHNLNSESTFGAINWVIPAPPHSPPTPPPPTHSPVQLISGGHLKCWAEKYSETQSYLDKMLWLPGGGGVTELGAEGTLTDHLGTKPHLEGSLQCLTFLAARKPFLMFCLNNSCCNFSPAFLFTAAVRTGLSASSDPVTLMIKSAIKLPFPSLLLPCAK